MGDPWQEEGFAGGDAGEDDWDDGKESVEADLDEEPGEKLMDADELGEARGGGEGGGGAGARRAGGGAGGTSPGRLEPWLESAPVHVLVCTREDDYHERYLQPDK